MLAHTPLLARVTLATLAAALLAAAGPACLACNDIGCDGGFEWTASAEGAAPLTPGTYAFEITLEDSRYTFDCIVAESVGESDCDEPEMVEGDIDFFLSMSISHLDPGDWNPEGPSGGFYMRASDASDSDDSGHFSAIRGPEVVHIVVLHDGQPFLDVDFDVTYQRDDDYRGDERCGYCDQRQERETQFTQ